jgi:putative transposase
MPRNARRKIDGLPVHVVQRGNDRSPCFRREADHELYIGLLVELAPLFECDVHAYALMTNHVHMLMTPRRGDGPSHLMKHLGQRFVQHFNRSHSRTGTLWEGRFRSHLVDSDSYLFQCQRYIELNPVRAQMVSQPWMYRWTSYRANAGLEASLLVVPHPNYLALGANLEECATRYRTFFREPPGIAELADIRRCINTGSSFGSRDFLIQLEERLGRRPDAAARGRPKGKGRSAIVPPDGKRGLSPV